VPNW